jgi:hypothetical protein
MSHREATGNPVWENQTIFPPKGGKMGAKRSYCQKLREEQNQAPKPVILFGILKERNKREGVENRAGFTCTP